MVQNSTNKSADKYGNGRENQTIRKYQSHVKKGAGSEKSEPAIPKTNHLEQS